MNRRIDSSQMTELRRLLDAEGVEYEVDDSEVIHGEYWSEYVTHSPDFETENGMCVEGWSCVLSNSSYGHDFGLLEFWGKGDEDVSGFLSAENAMERIRRTL